MKTTLWNVVVQVVTLHETRIEAWGPFEYGGKLDSPPPAWGKLQVSDRLRDQGLEPTWDGQASYDLGGGEVVTVLDVRAWRDADAVLPLVQAARCALADLQGIMPEFEPGGDREHPAWQSIVELQRALHEADLCGWGVLAPRPDGIMSAESLPKEEETRA